MKSEGAVFVLDDDADVCRSLADLLEEAGLTVRAYRTARAFLAACGDPGPACLVLDMCMPGMSGIRVLEQIVAQKAYIPVVVASGYGDVSLAAHAMKIGAIDFIEKPFRARQLLDCVREALDLARQNHRSRTEHTELARRIGRLSARECQMLKRLTRGETVKEVARTLERSYNTVYKQKQRLMRKLDVHSRDELERVAARAGLAEV